MGSATGREGLVRVILIRFGKSFLSTRVTTGTYDYCPYSSDRGGGKKRTCRESREAFNRSTEEEITNTFDFSKCL